MPSALEDGGGRPSSAPWSSPTDVADPESVAALFRAVRVRWGRVDLLVNNAGTFGPSGTVDEMPVAEWQAAVATNLTGSFLCAREAFAAMRAQDPQGGRIINNGSISAHVPRPAAPPTPPPSTRITGLTKSLSLDGRPVRHRVRADRHRQRRHRHDRRDRAGRPPGRRAACAPEPTFDVRHVADAVLYMAGLPLDANVQFLTVTATAMPFIGRG